MASDARADEPPRLYRYVGPPRILERVRSQPMGALIQSPDDVWDWIENHRPETIGGRVIATFVIDAAGSLRIADRRSEHAACAGGLPVRSAGEIAFAVAAGRRIEVGDVSNQSVGYCPEPESWPAVAEALRNAGLAAPEGFGMACAFRSCSECGNLTLIKHNVFECGVCGADLPIAYNVQ